MILIQIQTLLRKEFSQAKWPIYVGLLSLLVLPVMSAISSINSWIRHWHIHDSYYSLGSGVLWSTYVVLGMFYAVILAVALVSQDMRDDDAPDAWELLPIKTVRFFITKFFTGLSILLIFALGILFLDTVIKEAVSPLHPSVQFQRIQAVNLTDTVRIIIFVLIIQSIYALVFCINTLVRQVVPAVMLSAVLILLIFCGPLLVPQLDALNIWRYMGVTLVWCFDDAQKIHFFNQAQRFDLNVFGLHILAIRGLVWFLLFQFIIVLICGVGSLLILNRRWALKLDAYKLAWFFVSVGLMLLVIATLQVGNNLTPEKITNLSDGKTAVYQIILDGDQGVALTWETDSVFSKNKKQMMLRRIDLSQDIKLADHPAYPTGRHSHSLFLDTQTIAWSSKQPETAYLIQVDEEWKWKPYQTWETKSVWLQCVRFDQEGKPKAGQKIDLTGLRKDSIDQFKAIPGLYLKDQTLWLTYQQFQPKNIWKIRSYDVSDPDHIKLIGSYDIDGYWGGFQNMSGGSTGFSGTFSVPKIQGLSSDMLWELRSVFFERDMCMLNDRVIKFERNSIQMYQRDEQWNKDHPNPSYVQFKGVSVRKRTPVERLIDAHHQNRMIKGDYLYVLINSPQSGVMVFDISDPVQIRKVGYYYAPGEKLSAMIDMPGQQIGLAGYKLHILNPQTW